jgi:lipopolysaccharide transport system permease protein
MVFWHKNRKFGFNLSRMRKINQDIYYTIESSNRKLFDWKELWQYRELFYFFAWRDLKVKYKQAVLGVVWVILQPLLTVVIFSLFFARMVDTPKFGLPYPVFVFSGLLLWTMFSSSVNSAGNSMLTNASIIKKIYFPRIIIPVSAILGSLVDLMIGFVLFVAVLVYYRVSVNIIELIIAWPLSVMSMLLATLGISCWLAALNVKYRDFRYVVPFVLQIGLFVSPVIYQVSNVDNLWLKYILMLNPMYGAITLFRVPLTDQPLVMHEVIISLLSVFFFLLCGVYYFKRTESYFADIV